MSIIKFFFMKLLDSWNMLKFLYEGFYASWWNVIGVNCIACWVRLKCSWVFLLFQYFEKVVKFHLTKLITAIKLIFSSWLLFVRHHVYVFRNYLWYACGFDIFYFGGCLYAFHCMKSIKIRSFFWSVLSCIWTEYGPKKIPHLDNFHAVFLDAQAY